MSESAAATSYRIEAEAVVYVDVRDPDVIERVTGPKGDEWRQQFYPLRTIDDVLHHFAYNAIANGVLDVRRLDGWADVAEDAVTLVLDEIETHAEPWS
jgi:hypothetical protein